MAKNFRPFSALGDCRRLLELLSTTPSQHRLLEPLIGNRLYSQPDDDEKGSD
jgi:hypothetical protein